jgi:hypothetical protein
MRTGIRWLGMVITACLLLMTFWVALAQSPAEVAAMLPDGAAEGLPLGGFHADGSSVNTPGTDASAPALAVEPGGVPWVALAQDGDLIVAKLVTATAQWQPQGERLNFAGPISAAHPALALGDMGSEPAWTTWAEAVAGNKVILAAYFDGTDWQPTGKPSLVAPLIPALNRNATAEADHPAVAVGAAFSASQPLPWIAWEEQSNGASQIFVSRAVVSATAHGGYDWQRVGDALNFDPAHDGLEPDLAFAGAGNHTPWLAWTEESDSGSTIFAARAITDRSAAGGVGWQPVGTQTACLTTPTSALCRLHSNATAGASDIRIAAGRLADETVATPWVVFTAANAAGRSALRVLRLDSAGTPDDPGDDRFIPVGGAVDEQCLGADQRVARAASQPDLFFVGTVPHVAWIDGGDTLFVCHLGDARPGQERWDLDSVYPLNRVQRAKASAPSLGSDGNTPYVAWQETDDTTNVYVAHRYPDGPAWGRNYPPFIRTISWSRDYVGYAAHVQAALDQSINEMITRDFTFTTSCDHVNGWEEIEEIHFKLANDQRTAFLGKYVKAEDRFYIANEAGQFEGPYQAGTGAVLETPFVLVNLPQMRVRAHGFASPALDIDWVMSFRSTTMLQDFSQQINIIYADRQPTGFFETGLVSLDYRVYSPLVGK